MKQIVVISGKGGTGKTVVSGALAALAQDKVMADCDVDAPNLHLLIGAEYLEENLFYGGQKAFIDTEVCVKCGKCLEVCRFGSITAEFRVKQQLCESCGYCLMVCPAGAIGMDKNPAGKWFVSKTAYGTLVHARLEPGEDNSGKLVAIVRKAAKEKAEQEGAKYVIIDGPPGTGCPVMAALSGVDTALVVTEPGLSAIHDMKRVLELTDRFKIGAMAVINKYDISADNSSAIRRFCADKGIDIAGEIPFSAEIYGCVMKGRPAVEARDANGVEQMKKIWNNIKKRLQT
ncbi:MAG: ATP-binding protein [Spirochaetia bacterium]|nr:ATP-binding protein [Spirochaetia bacterium]